MLIEKSVHSRPLAKQSTSIMLVEKSVHSRPLAEQSISIGIDSYLEDSVTDRIASNRPVHMIDLAVGYWCRIILPYSNV
jgi:hypothetical protein